MAAPDNKLKHLEFIQLTIVRMAANSFLLKAWAITLVVGIFALSVSKNTKDYVLIAYLPVTMFWALDGYYLHQEKLFRALYDKVISMPANKIDMSMKTKDVKENVSSWPRSVFTITLVLFYGVILLILLAVSYVIFRKGN